MAAGVIITPAGPRLIMNLKLDVADIGKMFILRKENVHRQGRALSPDCTGWPWCQPPCFPENLPALHCSAAALLP